MAITAAQVKELREKTGVGMMECKKALSENGGDLEKAIMWLRERGMSRAAKKAGRTTAEGMVQVYVNEAKNAGVALELNCETDFVSKNKDFQEFAESSAKLALEQNINDIDALNNATLPDGTKVADKVTSLIATIGENINLRRVQVLKSDNGKVGGYSHMGGKIGSLVLLEGGDNEQIDELLQDLAMHAAAAAPRFLNRDQVPESELENEKDLARKKLLESGKPEELVEKIMVGQMNKFYKEVCFVDQVFVKDSKFSVEKLVSEQSKGGSISAFCRFQLGEGIEKKSEDFAAEVAAVAGTNS